MEEGDKCPYFGPDCCGRMEFQKPIDCSCHISGPCWVCTNIKLECNDCHYVDGDKI